MAFDGTVNFAGVRDRHTIATIGGYLHEQQFAWDASGNLVYRGVHRLHKSGDASTEWEIWKFTWTSGNLTRLEGPLAGTWTGRAALDWV